MNGRQRIAVGLLTLSAAGFTGWKANEGFTDNLQQIEHDLTAADGFYASKLDPEKRNQLLNTVTGRIYQVKEHQQRQAEMREVRAERVLAQMDRQAATGIPPTVADQQRWKSALSGTSMAGEYNTRVQEMNEVQGLLRKPMLEQQQYLDTKRRQLAESGGSVTQISNLTSSPSLMRTRQLARKISTYQLPHACYLHVLFI